MYIRTKDGVYEVEQSQLEDDEEVVNCEYCQISKLEIKRKSEKLEELCDEFVVWLDDNNCHFTTTNYLYIYQNRDKAKATFGAIWCEWGLKYVAKMNDKGELELI